MLIHVLFSSTGHCMSWNLNEKTDNKKVHPSLLWSPFTGYDGNIQILSISIDLHGPVKSQIVCSIGRCFIGKCSIGTCFIGTCSHRHMLHRWLQLDQLHQSILHCMEHRLKSLLDQKRKKFLRKDLQVTDPVDWRIQSWLHPLLMTTLRSIVKGERMKLNPSSIFQALQTTRRDN